MEWGNRKEIGNILIRGSGHRRKASGIIGGTWQASEIMGDGQKSSEGMTSLSIKEGHLTSYYTIGTIELIYVIGLVKAGMWER